MIQNEFKKDNLKVFVCENRQNMGEKAAESFYRSVKRQLEQKEYINIIFAAAPSQNEFLAAISEYDIRWDKINVFHMDEYVGVSIAEKQSFARFVKEKVVDRFPVRGFYPIDGGADEPEKECERYSRLLKEYPVDIVCCGIGENGHLAFNDPCNADFFDAKDVKIVTLDELCRKQQVNDGCFGSIAEVPKYALTLTMPALLRAKEIICVVPSKTKAKAVSTALTQDISVSCPASVLRIHNDARLYCDKESAELL